MPVVDAEDVHRLEKEVVFYRIEVPPP
jgi:hypothetical protein